MKFIETSDLRLHQFLNYLNAHNNVSFSLSETGLKNTIYVIKVFYFNDEICNLICFKGQFGIFFESIFQKHIEIVKEIFQFSYFSELNFTNNFFEFINTHYLFKELFNNVPARLTSDYYHHHKLSEERFNFIDPSVLAGSSYNYPFLNFKNNPQKLNINMKFTINSNFEMYSNNFIYPYPSLIIETSSKLYNFPIDIINKKIYLEKFYKNKNVLHKGLIIPEKNNKFLELSINTINIVIFDIINNSLDSFVNNGDHLSKEIYDIPFKHIDEKVLLFKINYLL